MKIRIQALAGLSPQEQSVELELPEKSTVQDAVRLLPIKDFPQLIYLVNNARAGCQQELHEGDSLLLVPPIAGG
jgi:molybdopterin converting factor small subunit